MEILGIGPLELLFIGIIALLLLGPKDMLKTGRTIGAFLRKIVSSEGWFAFRKSVRELRNLPYSMMREAGMEDVIEDVRDISRATKLNDAEFTPFHKKSEVSEPSNTWTELPKPQDSLQNSIQPVDIPPAVEETPVVVYPQNSPKSGGNKSTGVDTAEV